MRVIPSLLAVGLLGCATQSAPPVTVDPGEAGDGGSGKADGTVAIPDVQCSGTPDAGPAGSFNHFGSSVVSALGDPRHRGFDLVASATEDPQNIEGWISYGITDKALEDEQVDVFACRDNQWKKIGSATTDDEGKYSLALSGADRLPVGMRDLYVSVVGDRTGTGYLGYVAPDGSPLLVSDVDGTLTSSENAFAETIVLGIEPDEQAGASAAYTIAAAQGLQPVYVTARGNQYTGDTRQWLSDQGFPRGPVRLSTSFITLPGGDTIDYKTQTITALANSLDVVAGVGNRDSDITAYTNSGVAADHIFIKLPEFTDECAADLAAGKAIGFPDYSAWAQQYLPGL